MSIKIRPLSPDDRAPLADLIKRIPQFDRNDFAVAMELVDIALQNKEQRDYKFIMATDDTNRIVGYICYGPTPMTDRVFCLYWIAVDPMHADQGIGSELLESMEKKLKDQNARMIYLETSSAPNYEQTRHFYQKHNYQLVETFHDFFKAGEHRLTYFKTLQ